MSPYELASSMCTYPEPCQNCLDEAAELLALEDGTVQRVQAGVGVES